MVIHSKTGKVWSNDFEFKKVQTIDKADVSACDVIYYHHPYDNLFHNISFVNAIDELHFDHIRNNPAVTLVHENTCEAIDVRFAEEVYQVITQNNLNPSQVRIVTADENHKNFLNRYLESKNIFNTTVTVKNFLLSKVDLTVDNSIIPDKKFSALSRNYREWRLFLYEELYRHNLLKDFIYSFHNIWPYTDIPTIFNIDHMIGDLNKLGITELPYKFSKWLKRCPHDISNKVSDVKNKWSNVTYNTILSADIHLTVETHFDQKSFTGQTAFDRNFGPSSITEKAYKPIACTRPFIMFATPFFLEDMQHLGYKTFSPYINESYDTEVDNYKRLNMIVQEVNRICNLPTEDYNTLISNCKEVAEHNFKILTAHKKSYD
jgi:hypothetical protein